MSIEQSIRMTSMWASMSPEMRAERCRLVSVGRANGRTPRPLSSKEKEDKSRRISMALTGHQLSAEHRAALSRAKTGKRFSESHKKKIGESGRGRIVTEETRQKQAAAHRNQRPTAKCIAAVRAAQLGRKWSIERRQKKATVARRGDRHPQWKGGITPKNSTIRLSLAMKLWRESVFQRDKYTCQGCGKCGGNLNAHHILGFAEHPEARFDIENGATLCEPCHRAVHRRGANMAGRERQMMESI